MNPEGEDKKTGSEAIIPIEEKLKQIEPDEEKRKKILSFFATRILSYGEFHSGPLPSPKSLKQYVE